MNLQFQYPFLLWGLLSIPVFLLLYLGYWLWRKRVIKKMGNPTLVKALFSSHSHAKAVTKLVLIILAFGAGIIALANPRIPDENSDDVRKGIDVMLALDVSNSMLATDVSPNRLLKAKQLINRLIERMPDDRIGLVLFAGNAYVQAPLTTDHSIIRMYISTAGPGIITAQGTALGDAIQKASLAFNEEDRFKTIVLISDGETHDENAVGIASELAVKGTMINTIGIGSAGGSAIIDSSGNEKRDETGNVIISKLNEQMLQQLAQSTNGTFINLQNTDEAVNGLLQQFSQIERKAFIDVALLSYKSFYYWLAIPMLLFCIVELFTSDRKKRKA